MTSSLPALPLVHSATGDERLRGVVTDHDCALVGRAAYRNLLLLVNTAHTYTGTRLSHGCRQDIMTILGVETHLFGRAHGYARHR